LSPLRQRHHIGAQITKLGGRRGVTVRYCLWSWRFGCLAPIHCILGRLMVCTELVRRNLARGLLVFVREPSDIPVPAHPVVLQNAYLGSLSVAGVADQVRTRADTPRSSRRFGFSFRYGLCVFGVGRRPRRHVVEPDRQSHFFPRSKVARLRCRNRSSRALSAVRNIWTAARVSATAFANQAHWST